MTQLAELIKESAVKATENGHKIGNFTTWKGGAMARCRCGRHIHVATENNTVYGSATYRECDKEESN